MYTSVIPYFLAAYIIVNDTSEWTFGPEYSYDFNMTYIIRPDRHDPHVHQIQLISTVKCRPKLAIDTLFCHLYNITESEVFENEHMTREAKTEEIFEIKFNEHGVEGLLIEPPSRMEIVNVLRKIATQFNVIIDRQKIGMPQYMARENSTMGDCAATYKIMREESDIDTFKKTGTNFELKILPLDDAKPGTTLLIEKSRMGCINPPRYVDFSRGLLEMRKFISKIQVNSNKFETSTEFDGIVRFPTESEIEALSFTEIMQINLNSIEPAQNELPSLSYAELIDLNFNNDIPSNYIN